MIESASHPTPLPKGGAASRVDDSRYTEEKRSDERVCEDTVSQTINQTVLIERVEQLLADLDKKSGGEADE